jgi:hypothetical protein
MKTEILQGYRTFIGFLVGTGLVAWCLWLSRTAPGNFVGILGVWTGIYSAYLTKNYHQGRGSNE